jgi:hypothetical protein
VQVPAAQVSTAQVPVMQEGSEHVQMEKAEMVVQQEITSSHLMQMDPFTSVQQQSQETLNSLMIGKSESPSALKAGEMESQQKKGKSSEKVSRSLSSSVSPEEIIKKRLQASRILNVTKEDVHTICQMLKEYNESINYRIVHNV